MTNSNAAQVDNQLSLIEDALGKYAAPLPQIQSPDLIREQAVDLLNRADVLESNADELRTELHNREQVVHDIDRQLATLIGLVEEGKACLRSGEPVRPECGMAPALLPEVQNELVAAQQVAAATRSELSACQHQIDMLNANVSRAAEDAYLSAHLAYVSTLLRESMDLAAMAGAKVSNGAASVTLDRRLGLLLQNQGMVLALKNYQGDRANG